MTHTTASIPVDLKSPGQVLACMGFLEAAEVLLGGVEACFDWRKPEATFVLRADGDENPFGVVVEFLANATVVELTPIGYVEGGAADDDDDGNGPVVNRVHERAETPAFHSSEGDRNALPIQLVHDRRRLTVSHWADGSSRDSFKLYSGNRSAHRIATQMLHGVRAKPKKNQPIGDLERQGLQQLWQAKRNEILRAPFEVVTSTGGSFNFDPRGAWTANDAGYSLDTQEHGIAASPVVEILAAIGLEHARPDQYETRKVRYAVWGKSLPPILARAALSGADLKVSMRRFEFTLALSGKNKITTFAREETQR